MSLLFAGVLSCGELTVAVLLIVPGVLGAVTLTTMLGAVVLGARLARVHVTVPDECPHVHPAPVPVNETNVVPAGSVSVTVIAVAAAGPPFATLSV